MSDGFERATLAVLRPWLDHRWKCAISKYLRSNQPPPNPYPVCDCGFDEHVAPALRALRETP